MDETNAPIDHGAATADELTVALLEMQLLNFIEDHIRNVENPMAALRQLSIALSNSNGAVHGMGLQLTLDQMNLKTEDGLADGATDVANAFERCALGITYQSLILIAILRDGLKVNLGLDDGRFKLLFDLYGGGDASKLLEDIDRLGITYVGHFQTLMETRRTATAESDDDDAA